MIADEPLDPYFCNIEEAIDECERRIKAEESRYAKLVANRDVYEHWMDPYDFKVLMRESATRLVNFDPCFDLPAEAYPLPRPWEQSMYYPSRQCNYHAAQMYHDQRQQQHEFALPRLPRRSQH